MDASPGLAQECTQALPPATWCHLSSVPWERWHGIMIPPFSTLWHIGVSWECNNTTVSLRMDGGYCMCLGLQLEGLCIIHGVQSHRLTIATCKILMHCMYRLCLEDSVTVLVNQTSRSSLLHEKSALLWLVAVLCQREQLFIYTTINSPALIITLYQTSRHLSQPV